MLVATSPTFSTSSNSIFGSPQIATSQTSAFLSPCTSKDRFNTFCQDGDSDEDDDLENIDPRLGPFTPCKGRLKKYRRASPTPSPSKFIIKGTVTPSRAAPLFTRYTTKRRTLKRATYYDTDASGTDEYCAKNECVDGKFFSKDMLQQHSSELRRPKHATYLPEVLIDYPIPKIQIPFVDTFRSMQATENTASYLMSIKSNSLHSHRQYASLRGNFGGSLGRGVLGVSRMLGAGGGYTNISHRALNTSLTNLSIQGYDYYYLTSQNPEVGIAQPLCGEYSYSSRNLDNYQAQWLAVGDNEGRVNLLNTLSDPMAAIDTYVANKPRWDASTGSIFELRWRFDDEMIATGGSDYVVRVWCSESGALVRTFKGHRGSPRTLAWDPDGSGHTLVSAGRDGAIHVYDLRLKDRSRDGQDHSPCLSIWDAHTSQERVKAQAKGQGSRTKSILFSQAKAVTAVTFLAGRGSNLLASAGCVDGKVKLWDLRYLACQSEAAGGIDVTASTQKQAKKNALPIIGPIEESQDLNIYGQKNKSSHGISHLIAGSYKIYASCTDGSIYLMNIADLLKSNNTSLGHPVSSLYHEAQRNNTLYARMSLHDDDRTLALACNSGVITVWDMHTASSTIGECQVQEGMSSSECCEQYQEDQLSSLAAMSRPALLNYGHDKNCEINSVSWAHGPGGPALASISDDFTIRLWHSTPRESNLIRERRDGSDWYQSSSQDSNF